MRGCLHKRKTKRGLSKGESSWSIILPLGRGPDGKHKQKWVTFHGTRKQAEQKLVELTGEMHRGEFVEPSKATLAQWLDEWLEKCIKPPRRSLNTYKSYRGITEGHLKPGLGHLPLQSITPLHIERYYVERAATLSPATVAVHHMILSGSLGAAQRSGLVRINAAGRTTNKPRVRRGEDVLDNVWTAAEAKQFLTYLKQSASTQYAALYAVALDGGMRKGELLGLRWTDIAGASVRVDRQLMRGMTGEETGGATFSLPKSGRARTLDLSTETLALLATHRREQAELKLKNRLQYSDRGLVFAQAWEHQTSKRTTLGEPLNTMTVNAQLDRLCREAGVKRITVHGLRHTCATLLLAAGTPAHVVQRRLGHAKIEVTLNLYAHVLPSMQADAAARLAALLHG